jgi:hypothetical protein
MIDAIRLFFHGMDTSLPQTIWALAALPRDRLGASLGMLAAFVVLCEFSRITLASEHTQSRIAHVTMCLLTFPVPAIALAIVLVHAAAAHSSHAWMNLAWVLGLYGIWYVAGESTKLVRPGGEGADLGFMTVGALITFPVGLIAALVFG